MTSEVEYRKGVAHVHINVDASGLIRALEEAGDAARRVLKRLKRLTWPRCARCHARPVDVDGVNPSLCTECEHRAAGRATAVLLAAMVVLSVAMILLGRIG